MTALNINRRRSHYHRIFLLFIILIISFSACDRQPEVGDQPFIPVDEQEVVDKLPEFLKPAPDEVIRRRFARFDFGFFEDKIIDGTDKPIKLALFKDAIIKVKTDTVIAQNDSLYVWKASADAKYYGKVLLSFSKHTGYGSIQVDSMVYEIMPIDSSIVMISEIAQLRYKDEAPPIRKQERMKQMQRREPPAPRDAHDSRLKVLVVLPLPTYSFICKNRFPFIDFLKLFKNVYQNNLNDAFNAVNPTGVTATVVFECYEYKPVGEDLIDDLDWVRTDPGMANLRNTHSADLVSLIVPSGDYCGRGYENYPVEAADEAWAFCVVKSSCAINNYSWAHEVGHNLGMRHDRKADNAFGSGTCNYGFIFPFEVFNFDFTARTIMAYGSSCGDCPRVGIYSNPTKIDVGFIEIGPMGVGCSVPISTDGKYTRANNRQQLIDAAPVASVWR